MESKRLKILEYELKGYIERFSIEETIQFTKEMEKSAIQLLRKIREIPKMHPIERNALCGAIIKIIIKLHTPNTIQSRVAARIVRTDPRGINCAYKKIKQSLPNLKRLLTFKSIIKETRSI